MCEVDLIPQAPCHVPIDTTMRLTVRIEKGSVVKLEVDGTATVGDLKRKIEETGVAGIWYRLIHNDEWVTDDDTLTVTAAGLQDGSCVGWAKMMGICVEREEGDEILLCVWCDITVGRVKRLIQTDTGIMCHTQMLTYKGKELLDRKTLKQCGVVKWGAKLFLCEKNLASEGAEAQGETSTSTAGQTATAKNQSASKLSKQFKKLEDRQTSQMTTMRTDLQELRRRCDDLSQNQTKIKQSFEQNQETLSSTLQNLIEKVNELEKESGQRAGPVHSANGTQGTKICAGSITEKFVQNYTKFFAIDLDIADDLYQERVISKKKHDDTFDRNLNMSRADRVRELLKDVEQSEANIKKLQRILRQRRDEGSSDLANLLD